MENKYDINTLIETFDTHSKEWHIQHEKNKINFPDENWVKSDFCIAKALMEICKEINELKQEIKYGKINQRFKP